MENKKNKRNTKKSPLKVIVVNPLTVEQEKRMIEAVSKMLQIKYYS